jgi:GNAT superfamily N-acetyltransferase
LRRNDNDEVEILPLDSTDDRQLDAVMNLLADCDAVDRPTAAPQCRVAFTSFIRSRNPNFQQSRYSAQLAGQLAGSLWTAMPLTEDLDDLYLAISVHPRFRGRGVADQLMRHAIALATDNGRHRLLTEAFRPIPGNDDWADHGGFATRCGFQPVQTTTDRRLALRDVDQDAETEVFNNIAPSASDYELVHWSGDVPDEYATEIARLESRIRVDVPRGDAAVDAVDVDVTRMRRDEAAQRNAGVTRLTVAVRHRIDGRLAAYTRLHTSASTGEFARVAITLVDPAHRGRRLGTLVKVQLHRLARRELPAVRYIDTGNDDENSHIIAINDRLGYVPLGKWDHYRRII